MNVYEVRHDGHYLGGLSIVVAENEFQALELAVEAVRAHGLSPNGCKVVRPLSLERPFCYVLDDGDY